VPSEALRVLQFRDICFANNGRMSDAVLWELGKLMNASQTSRSTNYDRSCLYWTNWRGFTVMLELKAAG
jgi:galactokinase